MWKKVLLLLAFISISETKTILLNKAQHVWTRYEANDRICFGSADPYDPTSTFRDVVAEVKGDSARFHVEREEFGFCNILQNWFPLTSRDSIESKWIRFLRVAGGLCEKDREEILSGNVLRFVGFYSPCLVSKTGNGMIRRRENHWNWRRFFLFSGVSTWCV